MIDTDKKQFTEIMKKTSICYGKEPSAERIVAYWDLLKHADIDQIAEGFEKHIKDPDRGKFFPVPADILSQLGDDYAIARAVGKKLGLSPTATESNKDYISRMQEKTRQFQLGGEGVKKLA